MDNRKMISIKSFSNALDAEVARQHLESHGIEAMVSKDDSGGARPWLQGIQGVFLHVIEQDSSKAEKILKAMKS